MVMRWRLLVSWVKWFVQLSIGDITVLTLLLIRKHNRVASGLPSEDHGALSFSHQSWHEGASSNHMYGSLRDMCVCGIGRVMDGGGVVFSALEVVLHRKTLLGSTLS